jgi:hypothetical protein
VKEQHLITDNLVLNFQTVRVPLAGWTLSVTLTDTFKNKKVFHEIYLHKEWSNVVSDIELIKSRIWNKLHYLKEHPHLLKATLVA